MAICYKDKKPFHPLLISLVGSVQEYVDVPLDKDRRHLVRIGTNSDRRLMIGASKNLFDMEIGWKSFTHYKKKKKNISANLIILMLIFFTYRCTVRQWNYGDLLIKITSFDILPLKNDLFSQIISIYKKSYLSCYVILYTCRLYC